MKARNQGVFITGFGDVGFHIVYNNEIARSIASFLFADFPGVSKPTQIVQYKIISRSETPEMTLWENKKSYLQVRRDISCLTF